MAEQAKIEAIRILPLVGRIQVWTVPPTTIKPYRSKDRNPWQIGTSDAAHKKFRIYSKPKGTWVEVYDDPPFNSSTKRILSMVDVVDEESGICTTTYVTELIPVADLISNRRSQMEAEAVRRLREDFPNQELYLQDDVQFHQTESIKDKTIFTPELKYIRNLRAAVRLKAMDMRNWLKKDIIDFDPVNGVNWPTLGS